MTTEDRRWEDGYRKRWQHDKIVRSTHGVNCTGSCSWKIYVKGGIVTWETQQTDYPRTRPDLPNHEPRGCSRGASYSWYLYSGNRVKYPLVRSRLLKLWREARVTHDAGRGVGVDRRGSDEARSLRREARAAAASCAPSWDEVNEIIAAANAYTAKTYGPDRVIGFSPIPAMSMVSYAAGARYLSLIGGVCMSFYDWYCDLPPASPQTWGEQTDVPESADWYNSGFIILWGSNVPQTRTPDAHFYTEVRYKGAKSVVDLPGLFRGLEVRRHLAVAEAGHRRGARDGDGPRHPAASSTSIGRRTYFSDYVRQYTDMPMLVRLVEAGRAATCPERFLRASDFDDGLGEANNPEWKTVAYRRDDRRDRRAERLGRLPLGRDRANGISRRRTSGGQDTETAAVARRRSRTTSPTVALPLFRQHREHDHFLGTDHAERADAQRAGQDAAARRRRDAGGDGATICSSPTTASIAASAATMSRSRYDDDEPYTPAWAEKITGVPRDQIITVAREFAANAREDQRPLDGHRRRGDEPLVPHGHELPRRHQHAGDVRLRRPIRRRLVALRRPGKAAAADRLDAAGLRARLEPSAAPDELDLVLLCAHRPVALRNARRQRNPVADCAGRRRGTAR